MQGPAMTGIFTGGLHVHEFQGYHSEWNLGSPGGWDYQRITQLIGKAVWEKLNQVRPIDVSLDFDHPKLFPIQGFLSMLEQAHQLRGEHDRNLIAVVAEEETLDTVTENRNLAEWLNSLKGLRGGLMAPQELELYHGEVCWKGERVSLLFMDFNTDVLLNLHRKHGLEPVLQAVRENRVINPRGTEPINVKSTFEIITGPLGVHFHDEIVSRTPWTRQFYPRSTQGPKGERIADLIEWTRKNWDKLVLKPERGYSGKGVKVGGVYKMADEAIDLALHAGDYILQEKIPLELWAEDIPSLDTAGECIELRSYQTDFRCLVGSSGLMGFLGRYGGVPTNVGSGGGVQPLAVLHGDSNPGDAIGRINDAIMGMSSEQVLPIVELQKKMAMEHNFTYLLGPIKIALRPRVLTERQIAALTTYCSALWNDCMLLERMWRSAELDDLIHIEDEELEIARAQPWEGGPAIIASDGLFNFLSTTMKGEEGTGKSR
jgi:hypothetical protein